MSKRPPDTDLLREMSSFAAERLVEMEVGAMTGAAQRETGPDLLLRRNGCRHRDWQTRDHSHSIVPGGLLVMS
ncbi:hypothetical protein AcidC75_23840 [Acidisoma sp. C75]